jgi:F-type H+-transporting ATPase subunit a
MDFMVGLLELVLEPVKMVSLTFRLLGNIFGGAVLLLVVSTLANFTAFLLPTALYLYEMFVGAIQAYVFFMLTLVYSSVAMTGHGGDEHH